MTGKRKRLKGISNNYVFSVCEDNKKNIWVSTNDGVHGIFDPEKAIFVKRFKNPHADAVARGMIEDRFNENILWFGTEADGLFKFEKDTGHFMQRGRPLILAVDDKPQNLQILGKLLSECSYEVGMAQNGRQALNFVKKQKPDLILLDIMMPDMDGYQVCETLKADFSARHIPIIFLSAKSDSEEIVKGFEIGGSDYVTKPFNSSELIARIKTHLEIKILRGLLPMCSKCKKIRNDDGFWKQVDLYIEEHSQITFTHGICPDCLTDLYGEKDWFKKKQ